MNNFNIEKIVFETKIFNLNKEEVEENIQISTDFFKIYESKIKKEFFEENYYKYQYYILEFVVRKFKLDFESQKDIMYLILCAKESNSIKDNLKYIFDKLDLEYITKDIVENKYDHDLKRNFLNYIDMYLLLRKICYKNDNSVVIIKNIVENIDLEKRIIEENNKLKLLEKLDLEKRNKKIIYWNKPNYEKNLLYVLKLFELKIDYYGNIYLTTTNKTIKKEYNNRIVNLINIMFEYINLNSILINVINVHTYQRTIYTKNSMYYNLLNMKIDLSTLKKEYKPNIRNVIESRILKLYEENYLLEGNLNINENLIYLITLLKTFFYLYEYLTKNDKDLLYKLFEIAYKTFVENCISEKEKEKYNKVMVMYSLGISMYFENSLTTKENLLEIEEKINKISNCDIINLQKEETNKENSLWQIF